MPSPPNPTPPTAPLDPILEPHVLWYPELPPVLDGLTILQISDLHVRDHRARHDRIVQAVADQKYDLLLITGDIMNEPGHEKASAEVMKRICRVAQPRLGTFAELGNHDSKRLKRDLADLPVHWLHDQARVSDELPLSILGLEYDRDKRRGDLLAAILDEPAGDVQPFRILMAHAPEWLVAAADAGIDLVFSGHTHGGQVRLPGKRAIITRCDWPLHLTAGVLAVGSTRAIVSRGLGEAGPVEGLRLLCKPHLPMVTLCRGESETGKPDQIVAIKRW